MGRLPRHIAIIMDGNGRWAERRGVPRAEGHEAGAKGVRKAVEACRELGGIEVLTLYAFSTENWRRSTAEVDTLFHLFSKYARLELDELHRNGIRVTFMGQLDDIPEQAAADLAHCSVVTADNTAMTLNIAINYGARTEIVDAAKSIAREAREGALDIENLTESVFAQYLYRPELPDVDLLVRTSGERRLSNFMLWQVSYAEFVMLDVLWPDFGASHLREAIAEYQTRQRRYGGR